MIQPRVDSVKTSRLFQYSLLRCFPIKSNLRHSEVESRSTALAQPLRGPLPQGAWPCLPLPPHPCPGLSVPSSHAAWTATPAYKSNLSLETSDPNQMAIQHQHRVSSASNNALPLSCLTWGLGAPLGSCPVNHSQLVIQTLAAAGGHDLSERLRDYLRDIPLSHIMIS